MIRGHSRPAANPKNATQIANIRTAGGFLTDLLYELREQCVEGATGQDLNAYTEAFLTKRHLQAAFLGYQGFPASLCVSVNDCVVHGIPDAVPFATGDLVKVDVGVVYHDGIADAAISIVVGGDDANPAAAHLIHTTKAALDAGCAHVRDGISLYNYGAAVQDHCTKNKIAVIPSLTGHGVGAAVHEPPHIHNVAYKPHRSKHFLAGMVVALEPITALRSREVYTGDNDRNIYTSDGDLGAQREYTVLVTDNTVDILAGIDE